MKYFTREQALQKSIEYFKGDSLAAEVFINKYALRNDKEYLEVSPEQMHRRLAKEFARIEKKYPNPLSEEEIFNLFDHFKYVVPQGSPMFGIGNEFQKVSISNCFVIDVVDSYGGICRADERIAQIAKRRGGVGLDISPIRPKGLPTKNSALTTDGIVVFMERFSNTAREVAQNGRRGALLISISVHHPEILNFIRAKRDLKKVTGANISVRVSDEFMNAVKHNKNYEQRWPVDSDKPTIKQQVNAREIWSELIKSNWMAAEPGILFWDTIIKNSPSDSYADIGYKTMSTNPCITGDTLVYVADGRGNVPIRQLSLEGKDVPVFCYDDKENVTVRTMRNPRITGYRQPIYKITLDDGNIIRCTENHKIKLRDGSYKAAKDLVSSDSLKIIVRNEHPMPSKIKSSNPTLYYWIVNGLCNTKAEHRFIAEFNANRKLLKKEVIHHKDYNGLNNSFSNLEIISEDNHAKLHGVDKMGDKNPMRRAKTEWSKEKWKEYRDNMSNSVSKEKNGRYLNITNQDLFLKAIELTRYLKRRFSKKEWQKYARNNKLPIEFSDWRNNVFGGILKFSKDAAIKCGIKYINEDPRVVRTLQNIEEQGYKSKIVNGIVWVEKTCEKCGKTFWVEHNYREIGYCNKKTCKKYNKVKNNIKINQCSIFTLLKSKLNRVPSIAEWKRECKNNKIFCKFGTKQGFKNFKELKESSKNFNHRVVSVEIDGYEDVYNGTVDEFHNFFVGGFEGLSQNNKYKKWIYINNLNCGELPLCPGSSCILLLQNLTSYIKNPFTKEALFDEELFRKNTRISQKLIDDMVDLEIEAVDKIIDKIKSDPEDDKIKSNELDLWQNVQKTCKDLRRTGLGITGLGDLIAMLNIKYGSKESLAIVDKVYSILRDEAYRSSIEMAKERGAFPIWDSKKEKDNEFLNRLPEDILKEMKKVGRRNIACLTTSPAGSLSTLTQTTSGFEPVYLAEYIRKRKLTDNDKDKPDFVDNMGDKWKEYKIEHHGLKKFKEVTGKEFKDSPYFNAQAADIDYEMRVKMQGLATKYNCHAISSTINLPNNVSVETVDKLYIMAWSEGCKGLTVYRDGSRDGVLTKEKTSTRECDECDDASDKLKELVQKGQRPTHIILSPLELLALKLRLLRILK